MVDWEFITNVRNRTLGYFKTQKNEWTVQQVKDHMKDHKIKAYHPYGFVAIKNNDVSICVLPEFQNKGIGQRIMLDFVSGVKEPLFATIDLRNTNSFAFFKSVSESLQARNKRMDQ